MYKRKGLPAEGDLVVCTVKKITNAAVFVELDEYENVEGIIRIDEVAAGRIRSIRDYVEEGKKVICKVIKVYPANRTVDVSLRRVSEGLRKAKLDEYKKENIATKILEAFAKKKGIPVEEIYKKIIYPVIEKYELLYPFLQDVVLRGPKMLEELNIPKDWIQDLYEFLKQQIQIPKYIKKGILELYTLDPKGIAIIKEVLKSLKEKYKAEIKYKAAPEYFIKLESTDAKELNKRIKEIEEYLENLQESGKIFYELNLEK